MNWLGDYLLGTSVKPRNPTMTSDIIAIWAGILGLSYLAGAGLYFEMVSAVKLSHASASHGFGRRTRPQPVRIRHSR